MVTRQSLEIRSLIFYFELMLFPLMVFRSETSILLRTPNHIYRSICITVVLLVHSSQIMPSDASSCQDIFIGNVPLTVLHSDIERLFEDISPPVHIRINKRFAFVGLKDRATAELAVSKLHGAPFMGETLRVELGKSATRLDRRSPPRDRRGPLRPYERDSGRSDRPRPYPAYESTREPSRYPYDEAAASSTVQYPYYSSTYTPGCPPASQGPYDRLPTRPEQDFIPLNTPYYDPLAAGPGDRYGFREAPKRSSGYSTQPSQYRRR